MKNSKQIKEEIDRVQSTIKEIDDTLSTISNAIVRKPLEASKMEEETKLIKLNAELIKVMAIEGKKSFDWSKHEDEEIAKAWAETEKIGSTISFGNKNYANYIIDMCMSGSVHKLGLPGPSGTGKTSFARHIGYVINKPVMAINGTAGTTKDDFVGTYVLGEDGNMVFAEGPLLKMMRVGGIFVMEEMNFIKPQELAIINSLMDDLRQIHVPEIDETVRAHDEFVLIGTWNPGYGGTRDLNAALINRFDLVVNWSKMTEAMVRDICAKSGIAEARINTLAHVYESITNMIEKFKFDDNVISIRQIMALDKAFTATGNITTAIKISVLEQVANGNEDLKKKILTYTETLAGEIIKGKIGELPAGIKPMHTTGAKAAGGLADAVKEQKAKEQEAAAQASE